MRVISIYNNSLPHNRDNRDKLTRVVKHYGFETGRDGDYMFVIGGDGTFLKAMQRNMAKDPIYVGINTGNLGFLSEFDFDDVDKIFKLIESSSYMIQQLPIYEANVVTRDGSKKFFFLNDFVVERKSSRIIHSSVHINDKKFCNVSGDGLILSSSIGSTGYAVSSGGSISYDCDDVLQLNPVSPIQSKAYQSLTKTVILKDSNDITIFPSVKKRRSFRIVCDGNEIKLNDIKYIEVKKSKYHSRLLRSKGYDNTKNLREKILEDESD